jgi:hypothetical protein
MPCSKNVGASVFLGVNVVVCNVPSGDLYLIDCLIEGETLDFHFAIVIGSSE